jgi:Ca2+-binding RTX toxin-like protein
MRRTFAVLGSVVMGPLVLMTATASAKDVRGRRPEAVARPACTIIGTASGDNLDGTPGDDVICAKGGSDSIEGRGGNDIVFAGAGADGIYGDRGRDKLYGQGGDDGISGGPGPDRIAGGRGPDSCLDAEDGSNGDTVLGGPGTDNAKADLGDSVSGVEHIVECVPPPPF